MTQSDPRTDEQLVAASQQGDSSAFDEIVRRYSGRIYRLAWSFVKNDQAAEDVVQDTCLNAYRAIERFEGKSKLSSWIYRITVNASLMRLRGQRRRPEESLEGKAEHLGGGPRESPLLIETKTAAGHVESTELRGRIQMAVDELEPKYRSVFLLRDVQGLSIAEAAEVLEISPAAVKSRLHRSRLFLRASLATYLEKGPEGA